MKNICKKLSKAYFLQTKLCERLLHACQNFHIHIFLELETLVGYALHNGLAPWTKNLDFGILNKQRNLFLETLAKNDWQDLVLTKSEDEFSNEIFVVNLKDDETAKANIVFYEEKNGNLYSTMSCENKEDFCKNRKRTLDGSVTLPLKKTLFCGHIAYVPKSIEKTLAINHQEWWKLAQENQDYDPRFLGSPYKQMPKYETQIFANMKNLIESSKVPFIIRKGQMNFFEFDRHDFFKVMKNQKDGIYGYDFKADPENNNKIFKSSDEIWSMFENKTLYYNIVDSEIRDRSLLPPDFEYYLRNKFQNQDEYDFSLDFILTNAPYLTPFHDDGVIYGGGWMKICEGYKIWWVVIDEHYKYLTDRGYTIEQLRNLQFHELLSIEDNYLFGKVYIDWIEDGDFLYFPVHALHKVFTTRQSVGFGGYI